MNRFNFQEDFVHNTMKCVNSASFEILVNGQLSRKFRPGRGLRQGDPLCQFMFIMCAEGLSALLRDAEHKRDIRVKIGRHVKPIMRILDHN